MLIKNAKAFVGLFVLSIYKTRSSLEPNLSKLHRLNPSDVLLKTNYVRLHRR